MQRPNYFAARTSTIAGFSIATFVLLAPLAFAASPHFIKTPSIVKNADLSLTAKFKAAGLGNTATDIFLSSSGGSAEMQCVNPGGNNPPPKHVDFGPLQGLIVTVQPRNGAVSATPTIGPPALPGASEICPNANWDVDIISLTYENVVLHIQQDGVDVLTYNFGTIDP